MRSRITQIKVIFVPLLALLALSACAAPQNTEWQDAQYGASHLPVGILGPSGSIGP